MAREDPLALVKFGAGEGQIRLRSISSRRLRVPRIAASARVSATGNSSSISIWQIRRDFGQIGLAVEGRGFDGFHQARQQVRGHPGPIRCRSPNPGSAPAGRSTAQRTRSHLHINTLHQLAKNRIEAISRPAATPDSVQDPPWIAAEYQDAIRTSAPPLLCCASPE